MNEIFDYQSVVKHFQVPESIVCQMEKEVKRKFQMII